MSEDDPESCFITHTGTSRSRVWMTLDHNAKDVLPFDMDEAQYAEQKHVPELTTAKRRQLKWMPWNPSNIMIRDDEETKGIRSSTNKRRYHPRSQGSLGKTSHGLGNGNEGDKESA